MIFVIKKNLFLIILSFVCLLLFSCATNIKKMCPSFEYNSKMMNDIVIPHIKSKVGEKYIFFNFEKPTIHPHKSNIELVFAATKKINGKVLWYHDNIVMVYDCSVGKITRTYENQ